MLKRTDHFCDLSIHFEMTMVNKEDRNINRTASKSHEKCNCQIGQFAIYSSGSALVDQLSYMLWWTSYYLNKYSWSTINQGRRCTSYLYFNNSWSTIENMIAGRPWLILN